MVEGNLMLTNEAIPQEQQFYRMYFGISFYYCHYLHTHFLYWKLFDLIPICLNHECFVQDTGG